jgi:hypothetical protein
MRVPRDYPVKQIRRGTKAARVARALAECGTCGRLWDDGIVTGMTPAPSARCPFEPFH